jgi:catechol 2,3-dioxygenase-like lactoylglutathione lyase family enzyme
VGRDPTRQNQPLSPLVRAFHRSIDEFPGAPTLQAQNIGTQPVSTRRRIVDWTLELIVVPVSDVDRAKTFYMEQAGFDLLVDHSAGEDFRVVQLVPPGSACAIALLKNNRDMAPGTLHGLHLCVSDIEAARAQLVERGVDAGDYFHFAAGGQEAGLAPGRGSYETFITFHDPDGNTWLVQEVHRETANA